MDQLRQITTKHIEVLLVLNIARLGLGQGPFQGEIITAKII